MAKYKDLVGTAVTNYAGNNPGVVEGELWYDSSAYAWKYQFPALTTAGSWSTGGNLNTGRRAYGGAGTQTSALAFAGTDAGSPGTITGKTESYDGTTWTEGNDLNQIRRDIRGAGASNTAVLAWGGNTPPPAYTAETETWNGTNWTEVNDLNTARYGEAGAGTTTAALSIGGHPA